MTDTFLKSCKDVLGTRLVSPLSGAFLISWLAINHRFIFVLFSDQIYSAKFKYIDEVLNSNWAITILNMIIFPLTSAIAFIFLYPYPAKIVADFSRRRHVELINSQNKIDGDRLLTREESIKLIRSFQTEKTEILDSFDKKQAELNGVREEMKILLQDRNQQANDSAEIKNLRTMIVQRDEQLSSLQKELAEAKYKASGDPFAMPGIITIPPSVDPFFTPDSSQATILKYLVESNGNGAMIDEISTSLALQRIDVLRAVKKLKQANCAFEDSGGILQATEGGERYFIDNLDS